MAAILLIDDVAVVRTVLAKFLKRANHEVIECGGGAEAWSALSVRTFDIIVTDLWMKEGDGMEFIQKVRARGHKTPIIAITSGDLNSSAAADGSSARRAGADEVLLKPVTRTVLMDAITKLISAPAR